MHFLGVMQWLNIRKMMHFFKRKVSDKDGNCLSSTSTLKELPSDDQTVQPEAALQNTKSHNGRI